MLCILENIKERFSLKAVVCSAGIRHDVFRIPDRKSHVPFSSSVPAGFPGCLSLYFLTLHHCSVPDNRWSSLSVGIVTAVCATLSLGCGLLVWPVLVLICAVERPHKITIWAIAIAGIATWLLYFLGYVSPDDSARPWLSVAQQRPVAAFTSMFLVSVIHSTTIRFPGLLACTILLGTTAGILIYLRTSSKAFRKSNAFFMYLVLFILATAAITSLCRIKCGVEEASAIRYRLPVLIFWASIIAIVSSFSLSRRPFLSRSVSTPIIVLLFLVFVLLPAQRPTISYFAALSRQINASGVNLAFNPSDSTYTELFRIRPDLVREYSRFLRQNHLALFSDSSLRRN